MKPQVFVSSTFYDLKFVREDLSDFIKTHGFSPILFEDGDIGYTPGKELDTSCYVAMHNSDMVILIIGGYYGSPATGEPKSDLTEYISVTRNEFRTAIKEGIPVFVFIERKVYTEYEMYELNYEYIENQGGALHFKNTKDINVFRFIKEIKSIGHITITEFERTNEIKEFLSKQWSDMMKKYLEQLRKDATEKNTTNAVSDIRDLTKRMDVMLDSIGKLLLSENDKYAEVKHIQEITKVASILTSSIVLINYEFDDEVNKDNVIYLLEIMEQMLNDNVIKPDIIYDPDENSADDILPYFEDSDFDLVFLSFTENEMQKISKTLQTSADRKLLIELLCDETTYGQIFI